jgi:hypothetical protein
MRIRDHTDQGQKNTDLGSGIKKKSDPGFGMGKKFESGIRDKHPGSATLC